MAKHARVMTDEQRARLEQNRTLLLEVIAGESLDVTCPTEPGSLTLVLERFVVPDDRSGIVPFEGLRGVERLLQELSSFSYAQTWQDGRLTGVEGRIATGDDSDPVNLICSVGIGSQLVLSVGPSQSIPQLLSAISAFDRHVHLASKALGRTFRLLAQGYHPFVESPSDVVVVPTAANTLTNAHLSHAGRLARDMMRCTAGTRVRLAVCEDEDDSRTAFRLASALSPIIAFLCDNCLRVRGRKPEDTPRMARSLVWSQTDPSRFGLVGSTFHDRFGYEAYERWAEGVAPVFFASEGGICFSTGTDSLQRIMEERDLTRGEAQRLLTHVLPWARWDGALTLLAADALGTRQAGGYAVLLKGLLGSEEGRGEAARLLDLDSIDDDAVIQAFSDLRSKGWDARIYRRPIVQVAHELSAIARRNLEDLAERRLLDELSQLWEVGMVPRDTLLHSWSRNHPLSPEEEAAQLWGEGAVIAYDDLQGDPPAGSTAVMRLNQLKQD